MAKKPTPAKPAKPEPRPRRNGMVALSVEVPGIAKAALGSRGYAEAGLFTHWAEIAGASIAASSLPVKLSFPRGKRDDGTLTVRCGGSAALELQHLAPSVLERINGHFGYRAVARLKIEQGAVSARKVATPPPPLTRLEQSEVSAATDPVADAEIRASLSRLGTAIRRRDKATRGA
ncbi:MAG: DciA family protein [Dongiaceae bacterium]